jgi:hypothetical protein
MDVLTVCPLHDAFSLSYQYPGFRGSNKNHYPGGEQIRWTSAWWSLPRLGAQSEAVREPEKFIHLGLQRFLVLSILSTIRYDEASARMEKELERKGRDRTGGPESAGRKEEGQLKSIRSLSQTD